MADQNNSLINLGNFADSAKVLIERVSDAVGGVFKAKQITRIAKAEAKADMIRAVSKIEISELEQRALKRLAVEEASKQENIENITTKALPLLGQNANPKEIEKDWLVDFFDKCRLISDEEMQAVWSSILAGEANSPGTYKKRTIHLLASLEKSDIDLFTKICNFKWNVVAFSAPIILDTDNQIYKDNEIYFSDLKHLDSIGLISFEPISGYTNRNLARKVTVSYAGKEIQIDFEKEKENELALGHVIFTDSGRELSGMCEVSEIKGLQEYVLTEWKKKGIVASLQEGKN